jgi:poly(hydroxyalkanoate) granule-associated protein
VRRPSAAAVHPSKIEAGDNMVKKLKTSAAQAGEKTGGRTRGAFGSLQGGALAGAVKDSAQQIWLAGMGAYAKAQEEGGKVFEALVKEGLNLQKKTQGLAEEKISEVTGRMTAMADSVTSKAGQNWDKLEAIFEQRTAKAMGRLGVPTAKDVAELTKRVDELAAAVARLAKGPAAAPVAKRTRTAASKAAAPAPAKAPVKRAARKAA